MSLSWLDSVPGGRSAYDYVRGKLDLFQATGASLRGQLAELDRWWDFFPEPPHTDEQLTVWNKWVALRNEILVQVGRWDALNVVVGPVWQAVQDVSFDRDPTTLPAGDPPISGLSGMVGLGVVPWPLVIRVAGWLIALGVTLHEFFTWQASHENSIEAFVSDAVAAGAMSPTQAADVLREGTPKTTISQVTQLATLGVIAAIVMLVMQGQRRATA